METAWEKGAAHLAVYGRIELRVVLDASESGGERLIETRSQVRLLLGVPPNRLGGVSLGDRAEAQLHQWL
jgi:hypothetical protein